MPCLRYVIRDVGIELDYNGVGDATGVANGGLWEEGAKGGMDICTSSAGVVPCDVAEGVV